MKKKIAIGIIALLIVMYIVSVVVYKLQSKIALIKINGVISDYISTIKLIDIAKNDDSIKAVVIKVDSPGGAVGASQEIYRAIEKLRDKKTVVVSMGNVAASGGYYVSVPANVIYADPGTVTGSIGVIIQHVDFSKVLNKIGVKVNNIKSGKNKDILYPNHPLTPEQKELLQRTVMDVYNQFLDAIVKYRPIEKKVLKKYADGRVFSGKQALELKLVDKLGNTQDAIDEAKKLAGLDQEHPMIVELKKEKPLLEQILGSKLTGKLENIGTTSGLYYLMSF